MFAGSVRVTIFTTWAFALASFVVMVADGAAGRRVQYQDCGPDKNIVAVNVTGCIVQPCRLVTNSTVTFSIIAKSTQKSQLATQEVRALINGRPFGLPEPTEDACKVGMVYPECPIRRGPLYRFERTIVIQDNYPTVPSMLQFRVRGDAGQTLACVRIHALISSPTVS